MACAGGAEREAQAASCSPVSIADKPHPSFIPTHLPGPLLSCWTTAIFHHQALGTAPLISWLHCFQMGMQGPSGYLLLPGRSHPWGGGVATDLPKVPRAQPRCPGPSESSCQEPLCGLGAQQMFRESRKVPR